MSLNETMTGLMSAVRGVSGLSNKLSVDEATSALNQVSGFVDHGIIFAGDANNLVETGVWSNHGAVFNSPVLGQWGVFSVYAPSKGKDFVKQEWTSINNGATYVRMYDPGIVSGTGKGTWTAWIKLGGVLNRALSAFKHMVAPLTGGVAYVA